MKTAEQNINDFIIWVKKWYSHTKGGYRNRGDFEKKTTPQSLQSLKDVYSRDVLSKQFHPSPKEISEEEIEKNNSIIEDILVEFSERESDHIVDHSLRLKKSMEAVVKYNKIIEAVKPYLSLPSSCSKTEAVEFAEFIRTGNNSGFEGVGEGWRSFSKPYTYHSNEELFELFLKDKQQ